MERVTLIINIFFFYHRVIITSILIVNLRLNGNMHIQILFFI